MGVTPTKTAIIGTFCNGRNDAQDFLQLATNNGDSVFAWIDSAGILRGTLAPSIPVPGSTTDVISNQSGSLYGDSGFTYNPSTDVVTINGVSTGGLIAENLTPSTSVTSQPSPSIVLTGTLWDSVLGASVSDTWTIQNVTTSNTTTLTFTQSGTIPGPPYGTANVSFPNSTLSVAYNIVAGSTVVSSVMECAYLPSITSGGTAGQVNSLTSAAAAVGGKTTYQGTFPGSYGYPQLGQYATIAGFTNPGNNGRFVVFSSNNTSLTVYNSGGVVETATATSTLDTDFINTSNYGLSFGLYQNISIEGVSHKTPSVFFQYPFGPAIVISCAGEETDAGYLRIINDGSTGNHGLEIGGIVDGTGLAPAILHLGHFNGVLEIDLTNQLTQVSSLAASIVSKTGSYATSLTDHTVLTNSTGAVTITLTTTGIPVGQIFVVKNINTGTTTVQGQTGNIDGAASQSLSTQYQKQTYQWDGSNWWIIS